MSALMTSPKPRHPHIRTGLGLVLAAILVSACAGAASNALRDGVTPASTSNSGDDGSTGYQQGPAPVAGPTSAPSSAAQGDVQLIVRTGSMTLVVSDVPATVAKAHDAIAALGGYVSGSSAQGGDKPSAQVTYRIPVAQFDAAQAALRKLAIRIEIEHTDSTEVTGQVVDLAARLDNLRVTESALQAIMDRAVKIQDVLDVQTQLTEIRSQIEQLVAQKQNLEGQAALSTLTADFTVSVPEVTSTSKGWDPGSVVDAALSTLIGLGQGLASAGLWALIVGLPVGLGLGLVGLLVLVIVRIGRRLRPRSPSVA